MLGASGAAVLRIGRKTIIPKGPGYSALLPRWPVLIKPVFRAMLACMVLGTLVGAQEGKRDPETGRIRLLYIGDATNTRNPVYIYRSDPTFIPTLIPACRDVLFAAGLGINDIYKYMRQYMPKTLGHMRDSYDTIILSDVCVLNFRPEQIDWMKKCVEESGFGLTMVGGIESFAGGSNYPSWAGTPVADALPVEFATIQQNAPSGSYRFTIRAPDDELMRSLPWGSAPPFSGLNIVTVRDGAIELSKAVGYSTSYPLMAVWRYGQGRTVAFTPDWTPGWGVDFCNWEYYLDFASNLGLYSSRVEVPQDLALVHANRAELVDIATRKILLSSLFEFVDRFGASTSKLEPSINDVEETVTLAQEAYIRQDYTGSIALLQDAQEALKEIEAHAFRLKNRAMLWVYIIEWFAVLGTCFFSGTVLWAVMVRKRLYRAVASTRSL